MTLNNLHVLPMQAQAKVAAYLNELETALANTIEMVALYGSVLTGDYSSKASDINLLIILSHEGFDRLHQAIPAINKGFKERIAVPLFLTRQQMLNSVDVFPIEYMEIKLNHALLWGEDIVAGISIDEAQLRLFCEHEIKGKIIRIRQEYLANNAHPEGLENVIKGSMHALLPALRTLLRLKHQSVPASSQELIDVLANQYAFDASVLKEILTLRREGRSISLGKAQALMPVYLRTLEHLATVADQL